MKPSLRTLLAAGVTLIVAACATQFTGVSTLRGADTAAADTAPDTLKTYAGKRPGSGAPIARTFQQQPPLVPHAIDNFDEITPTDNQCMECHAPATAQAKKAPRIGDSHLAGANLRMERWQCNTCHVPQVDAKPLVDNRFVGNVPAAVK